MRDVTDDTPPEAAPTKRPVPKGFTPWKKGQSGNPGGYPKLLRDRKVATAIPLREFIGVFFKYWMMKAKDLDVLSEDRTLTQGDLIFISMLRKAEKYGDIRHISWILDRVYGKPVETEHMIEVNEVPTDKLLSLAKSAIRQLEAHDTAAAKDY